MNLRPLKKWFLEERRDFPWRSDPTPYSVWVSEIMLQQTRASVVIPYFERWMDALPSIGALAGADIDQVIKLWEGLGYYSRARNLHAGAQQVVREFDGELPSNAEQLATIKGIGPYTVGAILSFAFHQRAAALDGNVLRVVTRLTNCDRDIATPKVVTDLRSETLWLLPRGKPWVAMEALIELGATLCSRRSPKCLECPMRHQCESYASGSQENLPVKSKKVKITRIERTVFLAGADHHILIRKVPAGEIMAGLYEFPYVEGGMENPLSTFANTFGVEALCATPIASVSHTFTRYRATLHPHLLQVSVPQKVTGYEWIPLTQLPDLPFSSGHAKLRAYLLSTVDTRP